MTVPAYVIGCEGAKLAGPQCNVNLQICQGRICVNGTRERVEAVAIQPMVKENKRQNHEISKLRVFESWSL
jgi:3,4-dihydroxy-2-butanone 4-phosphate synthase